MAKYKYILIYDDGEKYDSQEEYGEQGVYNTYELAEEAGLYAISCTRTGTEILHMSNPGDYEYDEDSYQNLELEIIEIEGE